MATKNVLFDDNNSKFSFDYKSVLLNIANFRRSNGSYSDIRFDNPQTYFFKLFFFFDDENTNGAATSMTGLPTANLLGRTYDGDIFKGGFPWDGGSVNELDMNNRVNHVPVNTALNYLLLNYEWDRAKKLTDFITLLSDISCNYPWYFQSITGLDEALSRKEVTEKDFKIEEERKNIKIKCLPDAEDNKIGKLLDLYRNIVWSNLMKKEILPANLRKFDMGLLIFSRPLKNIHRRISKSDLFEQAMAENWDTPTTQNNTTQSTGSNDIYASFEPALDVRNENEKSTRYKTSYKYIEFHNCEFDYNSSASGYNTIDNANGFGQEYEITINFDDVFENRYDEFLVKNIGDFTLWDLNLNSEFGTGGEEKDWILSMIDREKLIGTSQKAEFDYRAALLSDKGSTNEDNKPSSERNDILTADGVGLKSSDFVRKGNEQMIISTRNPNGTFWEGTLIRKNQGMLTNAIRQLGSYAWENYGKPQYRKFVLGNFYLNQFKTLKSGISKIEKGNVLGAIPNFKKFTNGWKKK